MSDTSLILGLPYIQPAQAQKHVTHNAALRVLDAVVQLNVLSGVLSAPPATPTEGDRYLVPAGATGDWAGHDTELAVWDNEAWLYISAQTGWQAFVRDTVAAVYFDGTAWVSATPEVTELQNMTLLGVGTVADATNPLSVSGAATLLNHAGGDHQLKVNKAGTTDTASLLFQSDYTGHAEMGLAGTNGFDIKVSPDGITWQTGLTLDPATARPAFPQGADVGGILAGAGILGTAASGALFESAENTDGRYVRFADGTQICTAQVTLDYEGASRLQYDWTFPAPFADGSEVSTTFSVRNEFQATPSPDELGYMGVRAPVGDRNLGARLRAYRVAGLTDFAPGDEMVAYVVAVGQWQ